MNRHPIAALALGLLLLGCSDARDTAADDDDGGSTSGVTTSGSGGSGAAGGASGPGGAGSSSSGGSSSGGSGGSGSGGNGSGGSSTGGTSSGGSGGSGSGGSGGGGSGGSGGGGGGTDACGFSSAGGVWFEIDYSSAFTSTNPAWTYSATPGWGEPQWAANGSNWPEVWDLYQNINVSNDPIGKLAVVGPSGTLQIMIGLAGLTSYSKAVVCVEGRSVSTSASVIFDVYNPLNNCGATATMAHDWTVHAVGVDLGNCFQPNNNFQALRIEPSGGSSAIGIKRLRLTLQNANY